MSEKKEQYRGPIIFIVHSPLVWPMEDRTGQRQKEENTKKVLQALKVAATKGIPVLYSPEAGDRIAAEAEKMKKKPRIIKMVEEKGLGAFTPEEIARTLSSSRIEPTRIICMGQQRHNCVTNAAIAARKAYPKAAIVVPGGSYTFFAPTTIRRAKELRKEYRDTFRAEGIKTTRKKLTHAIRG